MKSLRALTIGQAMNLLRKLLNKCFRESRRLSLGVEPVDADTPEAQRYDAFPGSRQWSPGPRMAVDKATWKPCEGCGRHMPVALDWLIDAKGQPQDTGTWTGVCPFCGRCQVGIPTWFPGANRQVKCHECGTSLGESYQCPNCSFPRGWMRVNCPHCGKPHPVLAPHWVDCCDTFRLECAHCEEVFMSLCIC